MNGVPYFTDSLEISYTEIDDTKRYIDCGSSLRLLYRTIGKDLRGDCLINSENFQLNFIVGTSFSAGRSSTNARHLNLHESASTYLEIDMGINATVPEDMILIIYALYDRQIQIDGNRSIK